MKRWNSVTIKILLMVIIPIMILGTTFCIGANWTIENVVKKEITRNLKSVAYSVKQMYNMADAEDSIKDGKIMKADDITVTELVSFLDDIKSNTDIDVTLFGGDESFITSIKDSSQERIDGWKAENKALEVVLEKGEEYSSEGIQIK